MFRYTTELDGYLNVEVKGETSTEVIDLYEVYLKKLSRKRSRHSDGSTYWTREGRDLILELAANPERVERVVNRPGVWVDGMQEVFT